MLPENSELTLLDLIEIWISKKFLIIFLTIVIGIFFCIVHLTSADNQNFKVIIQIYPKLFPQIEQINKLQEIKNRMQYDIIFNKPMPDTISSDEKIVNFILEYTSPSRVVYEFSDLIKKKSLNNNDFKIIKTTSSQHQFFKNHINYFEFEFSFNDPIKSKSEIIKIFNDTEKNIKENYILILKELNTELINLRKQVMLSKIKKIDELITINNSKDTFLEKASDENNINVNLNTGESNISSDDILNFKTPLYVLNGKKKILELKLNEKKNYFPNLEEIINDISKEDFQLVEYEILYNFTNKLVKSNLTYFIIYFVLALIISMIWVIANFLYNNKKKLFK